MSLSLPALLMVESIQAAMFPSLCSKSAGGTVAFESIVDAENGTALIAAIESAFSSDVSASRLVAECGCRMTLLSNDPPSTAPSGVVVKVGGFRRIRKSDEFAAHLRITNSTSSTLVAPVTVIPGIVGQNVELISEDGFTCMIAPGGEPYLKVPTSSAGIAPGAHADITIRIKNPSLDRLSVQPRVYAGPGTR